MPIPTQEKSSEPSASDVASDDPFAIASLSDAHAHLARLRENDPVLKVAEGVYFISEWETVDAILRDPKLLAGSGVADSFGDGSENGGLAAQVMADWLMSLDGAEQNRARGLVRRAFTPRAVELLRPRVRAACDRFLVEIEQRPETEEIDLMASLAFALPSEVIRSLFGWPEASWREEIEGIIQAVDDRPAASIEMIEGLASRFHDQLGRKESYAGLFSELQVPDPTLGQLSPREVVANAVLLVAAAIDTTAGLIGNAIHCLLDRPSLLESLRNDPTVIPAVIEEVLRFEPPALSCSRRANEQMRIGTVEIPAGSQLVLSLAAANRDPKKFTDPNSFDLERDFSGGLSFGGGRHFCLGATLARMEAACALERLFVQSAFRFEKSEPAQWQQRNPTVRALERLPVRKKPQRGEGA